jgi:hypothetical protein
LVSHRHFEIEVEARFALRELWVACLELLARSSDRLAERLLEFSGVRCPSTGGRQSTAAAAR